MTATGHAEVSERPERRWEELGREYPGSQDTTVVDEGHERRAG